MDLAQRAKSQTARQHALDHVADERARSAPGVGELGGLLGIERRDVGLDPLVELGVGDVEREHERMHVDDFQAGRKERLLVAGKVPFTPPPIQWISSSQNTGYRTMPVQ